MNIYLRTWINRNYILNEIGHKIIDINNYLFYKFYGICKKNNKKIQNLKNTHEGESCFIIGNGPSLTVEDLDHIVGYDCFAANLIYKIFEKTNWRPKYYFLFDRYADTQDALDYLEIPYMFIGDYYWRKRGVNNKNAICVHSRRTSKGDNVEFSEKIDSYIISHWTVSYAMIQAAVYMGYKTIYLLGMDHNYALTFDEKGNIVEDNSVISHFFKDRNPKDVVANIEGMNKAYISAKKYADIHEIQIVNVTRGGKLEWFERRQLEDILEV